MVRHALRYELIALSRNRRRVVFTLAFPLLLLVVLTATAGSSTTTTGGAEVPLKQFFLPGIVAMSVLSGCFASVVMVVVTRRESGVTRRRELTPATRGTLVAALVLATAALAVAAAAFLVLVAKVAFGVGVSAAGLALMAVTVVLGAFSLAALAFLVARRVPTSDGAQPVVQLVMFPVMFLSGIWFPADQLPRGLEAVANAIPLKPLVDALRQEALHGSVAVGHLAVLAAWGIGAGLLASRAQRSKPQGPLATRRVSAASVRKTLGWRGELSENETVPASARTT